MSYHEETIFLSVNEMLEVLGYKVSYMQVNTEHPKLMYSKNFGCLKTYNVHLAIYFDLVWDNDKYIIKHHGLTIAGSIEDNNDIYRILQCKEEYRKDLSSLMIENNVDTSIYEREYTKFLEEEKNERSRK